MAELELPNSEELEELRSNKFTRTVALTTAVFAVLLAITSLGGNNAMKEMLLSQQQASDQWAYYQAKALREHLYKTNGARLEVELFERGAAMKPAAQKKYEELLQSMKMDEARFRDEKKKIEDEARKLEADRDRNQRKDPYFDYAEVLLQISIVLSSIAILALSVPIYYAAIAAASLGTLLMINGFLMLLSVPFFH